MVVSQLDEARQAYRRQVYQSLVTLLLKQRLSVFKKLWAFLREIITHKSTKLPKFTKFTKFTKLPKLPKSPIGMKVDGATIGTGTSARRFAGQDGVLADVLFKIIGTLNEGSRCGCALRDACQMQPPSCASYSTTCASSRSA